MPIQFGGPGVTPSLGQLVSTEVTLASGSVWCPPAGRWALETGAYTSWQEYDPVTGTWAAPGGGTPAAGWGGNGGVEVVFCDGSNYRLANQTGCPVGASVTTAGSGYTTTSPPTWSVSTGGSVFRSVIGGAVNTTVTVVTGGSNYTYPPIVLFQAPPVGGVPATGHATLSAGAVSTIVVDNQGGGYTVAPIITLVNDPREGAGAGSPATGVTAGSGANATCTLTGAGTLIAVLCVDHGVGGQTAVPTLTVSSGSGAATAVMCWTITAYVISTTTAGSGYATPVIISGYDTSPSQSANTNPAVSSQLVKTRNAFIVGAVSGSGISATGQVIKDAGIYSAAPTMFISSAGIQGAGAVQVTFLASTMGGQTDTSRIYPT